MRTDRPQRKGGFAGYKSTPNEFGVATRMGKPLWFRNWYWIGNVFMPDGILDFIFKTLLGIAIGILVEKIRKFIWSDQRRLIWMFSGSDIIDGENTFVLTKSLEIVRNNYLENNIGHYAQTSTSSESIICSMGYRMPYCKHEDLEAFGYIYGLFHYHGFRNTTVSFDDANDSSGNVICIGGPGANLETRKLLAYFRNILEFITDHSVTNLHIHKSGTVYSADENYDYGLVLKVEFPPRSNKYYLVLAGIWGEGTAGAAYYFAKNIKDICSKFGFGQFCIVVRINKMIGHRKPEPIELFEISD